MPFRISLAVTAAALVIATTTGCAPPSPSATPTPTFTSADQAYAAAEKTYRAYVDALNRVDLSEPKSFEAVYAWTTGVARAKAKESFTEMHADGWVVDGPTIATLVEPLRREDRVADTIDLAVCLDVANVTLVDTKGRSVVQPGRLDLQAMKVTLSVASNSPDGWLISAIDGRAGEPKCV